MIEVFAGGIEQVHDMVENGTPWTDVVMALTAVVTVLLMALGLYVKYRRKQGKNL